MQSASGSLFGLAYGDAFGRPTEFLSYDEILARGPLDLPAPAPVTDDTQMALAVASALLTTTLFPASPTPATLEAALRTTFVA